MEDGYGTAIVRHHILGVGGWAGAHHAIANTEPVALRAHFDHLAGPFHPDDLVSRSRERVEIDAIDTDGARADENFGWLWIGTGSVHDPKPV